VVMALLYAVRHVRGISLLEIVLLTSIVTPLP